MKITLFTVLFGAIFFAVAIYNNQKNKKRLLNQLSRLYGEKPEGDNDKFDMEFLKKYYNVRSENEEYSDRIDEITWNDLDMDSVFKRINYTDTTLGEAYLYYKLRNEKYDKDDWQEIEKLIKIFMDNEELRNNVKFKMMKVGKFNNSKIINFIYNPSFIAIKGYFKYPLLAVCLLASIVLSFVNVKIGMPLTILFLVSNALLYNCEKLSLANNYDVMTYLIKNLDMYARLSDIKDSSFNEYRIRIKDTLKNVKEINKIRMYSYAFSKGGNNLVNDLDFLADYLKMFTMTDVITYQRISKILEKNKQYLYDIYDFIAKIDFALCIAYYRASVDQYVLPEFTDDSKIEIDDIYHPLIDDPVKNSIVIDKNIIFTGSNASGKSTFIKAIALNCILAQSINTALCSKYKCRFSKVMTSMAIKDNILSGESYFVAELKSLKRLIDSLNGPVPVLAFIDEILKGTNTIERIAASASILKYSAGCNDRVFVATHDIELTEIADERYDNYHFSETVSDEGVTFDYKLKNGPAKTRNALKLLKTMNFDKKITDEADKLFKYFMENGKWTN